ncbi:MAG: TonB-dependent receptor, partial [Myxococcota bacterium]
HIHGQGYADLGFLISETVDALRVTEGVFAPTQGDFAVAGTIDIDLGSPLEGLRLKSSYGSFRTFRQLAMWSPSSEERTLAAVQIRTSDGFGENRTSQSASAVVQSEFGTGDVRYRFVGIAYGVRGSSAGVLRKDDVTDGAVGYYGVYPFATARAQSANQTRLMLGFGAEDLDAGGERSDFFVWGSFDIFRLQGNWTGFIESSRTLEDTSGRGDLIEQQNRTASMGLRAEHRTATRELLGGWNAHAALGLTGRFDSIEQAQNLLDASVRNQTWDERVDAAIRMGDLGLHGEVDTTLFDRLRLRVGARVNALFYDIDDRQGNFTPLTRPDDSFIEGFRRSAYGITWGPRSSLSWQLSPLVTVMAGYGHGYRSAQARLLEDGEQAPFTTVRSADLGIRLNYQDAFEAKVSAYHTRLSDDVAFEAAEGRLERIGATRRLGAVVYLKATPAHWFTAAGSLTYVDAELLEPPPATAEEPQPSFQSGENLPYVPPIMIRLDAQVRKPLNPSLGGYPLEFQLGTGFTYLSPRPLPYGEFASPVRTLDASVGLSWGPVRARLEGLNLLDRRYAAGEFNYVSNWDPDATASRTPARHFSAGPPRSLMGTVELSL